jgi:hypothetical protein
MYRLAPAPRQCTVWLQHQDNVPIGSSTKTMYRLAPAPKQCTDESSELKLWSLDKTNENARKTLFPFSENQKLAQRNSLDLI